MLVLTKNGASETVVTTGLLHDAFEDAGAPPQTINEQPADEVAELVNGASQSEGYIRESTDKKETWKRREANEMAQSINSGFDLKLIFGADRLSNLRDSLTNTNNEETNPGKTQRVQEQCSLGITNPRLEAYTNGRWTDLILLHVRNVANYQPGAASTYE